MILKAQNLLKSYAGKAVVKDVSLNLKQGEIVGLLGPNGAGKTTSFYMIVGLIKPNSGSIFLDDREITKFPMYKRAQNGIGYLAQESSVFRKMSVEDNIHSVLQMTDLSKKEQNDKVESLLDEFGLQAIRKSRGDLLSGGERRRTEIARALATSPSFILLDEPFAGVDPLAVEDIQKIVRDLTKKNNGKSGIIYCLSRKKVEEIAQLLILNNIKAVAYHAGLDSKLRHLNQDKFLMEDVDVVVATIAFGMGIDKPDIRFVIHYDVPKSLEGYYQETGRAGRDGGEGHCLAYYSHKDIEKLEKFLESKPKSEKDIASLLLEEVTAYCLTSLSRRKYLLNYFGEYFDSEIGEGRLMDDNMQNPKKSIDASEDLVSVLKLLIDTKFIYKQKDIVSILIGQSNALLNSHNITSNSNFGIGKSKDASYWRSLIWHARVESYMNKNIENYGSIGITELGHSFLENPDKFVIYYDRDFKDLNQTTNVKKLSNSGDETLMLLLKDLRKKIADKHSVPPYVIFQDPSLIEMTLKFPVKMDELSSIFGVGEGKSKKYGKEFIELISKYVVENNISRPDDFVIKSSGKNSSLKLFIIQSIDRKLSLDDIADSKSMDMMDFIKEMESIVYSGTKLDLNYCLEEYLDEDQQEEMYDYFIESESDSIELALEEFDGEFDEFELRLYRIKFLSELGN